MSRDRPISMRSFNAVLEIIQDSIDEEIPEDKVKNEVLSHNREFYKQASEDDLRIELMTRLMTEAKLAEVSGQKEVSEEIDEVVQNIKARIEAIEEQ